MPFSLDLPLTVTALKMHSMSKLLLRKVRARSSFSKVCSAMAPKPAEECSACLSTAASADLKPQYDVVVVGAGKSISTA